MSLTYVKVTVINPATALESEAELLVDPEASLTAVPRKILTWLGIKPIGKRTLRLHSGQIAEREVGAALIKYHGTVAGVTVIFAEENDTPVLGATALEALGYQLDPTTKQLKPVELLAI
jgi:predicted aspartyl protease